MIVHRFAQKDALAASVHSYLRQRQAQQYLKKYIYINEGRMGKPGQQHMTATTNV